MRPLSTTLFLMLLLPWLPWAKSTTASTSYGTAGSALGIGLSMLAELPQGATAYSILGLSTGLVANSIDKKDAQNGSTPDPIQELDTQRKSVKRSQDSLNTAGDSQTVVPSQEAQDTTPIRPQNDLVRFPKGQKAPGAPAPSPSPILPTTPSTEPTTAPTSEILEL